MEKLINLIKKLVQDKFYGSLEIKFESGNITLVRKIENIKL